MYHERDNNRASDWARAEERESARGNAADTMRDGEGGDMYNELRQDMRDIEDRLRDER